MGFPTTQWSLILASGDPAVARASWALLAERYRAPIRAYYCSRYGVGEGDDLTNAFFAASIAGDWWARADIDRGSFRTYLRTLLARFGARHANAGAQSDATGLETVADDSGGPEQAYDRAFASALVERALARLRSEYAHDASLFSHVLERSDQGSLKRLATELGVPQNSLSQRLRRLRLRLRELLRDEFAELVTQPAQIDAELLELRRTLSR